MFGALLSAVANLRAAAPAGRSARRCSGAGSTFARGEHLDATLGITAAAFNSTNRLNPADALAATPSARFRATPPETSTR